MLVSADESRVLIIYTGGTIGMLVGSSGYVPEPFFLTETLRSQSRFHDPEGDSLFSNARSVEGFREWTSGHQSGRATPLTGLGTAPWNSNINVSQPSLTVSGSTTPVHGDEPVGLALDIPSSSPSASTLLVRSSRPVQAPPGNTVSCTKVSDKCYEIQLPSLVTPASTAPGGNLKRIRYAVLEWNPLLDSSNMEIADWIRIAEEIELNYQNFDSFIILHGTDTMCYSSSALSFLLEDLGKTVILTGAQIPLSQLRNDAVENLLGALSIAGLYIIPECCLFFNHTLYRGNRVSKTSSFDLNAFTSPNFANLANVGIDIIVNWNDVVRPTSLRKFKAHKNMCPNVGTLRLFPGITTATVRAFLAPPIQGLVLETFGAGNAPQRVDLTSAFKEACDRGVVIVAISQCAKGSVSDAYETGRALQSVGVVAGGDMTPECALTKLAYLLSKSDKLTPNDIRRLISTPLRGELTLAPTHHNTQAPSSNPGPPSTSQEPTRNLSSMLLQITRLANPPPVIPAIQLSPPNPEATVPLYSLSAATAELSKTAKDITSPWSHTASEMASTEAAILPFLLHLAVSRDDIDTLKFCLDAAANATGSPQTSTPFMPSPLHPRLRSTSSTNTLKDVPQSWSKGGGVTGGIVNCVDASSGRTPLHVAAIHGSKDCTASLLESGALVHLRDSLDHTPLYYAARQAHEGIVNMLVQAGAHLGGADVAGGFVRLAVKKALHSSDEASLAIWQTAGVMIDRNPKLNEPVPIT